MKRRQFLKLTPAAALAASTLSGCGYLRIDPWHPLVRSPYLTTLEQEQEILSRARLSRTDDGRIRVLYVQGTPYERGYQQGALLREEVSDNLNYIYERAIDKFHFEELFAEVYERLRPFIPQEHIEEMHGLAHGARMPLHVVHHIHILPEVGEWGGKKQIQKVIKRMMNGELGTSCSNVAAGKSSTLDGELYAVRILDWGLHRISKLHEYPLITVGVPSSGNAYANIGWVGFLGAVSGMNEQGITLGEMGYGNPPNETLFGATMPFLLRDVLTYASNLSQVRKIISGSPGTCSYVYLMTDGKTGESELYIRDKDRFLTFYPGVDLQDGKDFFPAIENVLYGGHYEEIMPKVLSENRGKLTPELFMQELIPQMVMKSNFQNVVYRPGKLQFWVNNALDTQTSAATQPYTFFDLGKALREFKSTT